MDTAYGAITTTQVISKLKTLADTPEVRGVILPVENDSSVRLAYSDWDYYNACNPQAANRVADAIKVWRRVI